MTAIKLTEYAQLLPRKLLLLDSRAARALGCLRHVVIEARDRQYLFRQGPLDGEIEVSNMKKLILISVDYSQSLAAGQ